jgi:sigma-B regulation protein RsbU (phosphoserine phosphatase)
LSKEEEALFDVLLSKYMDVAEREPDAVMGLIRATGGPSRRPSDEAIYAYLSSTATPEQKAESITEPDPRADVLIPADHYDMLCKYGRAREPWWRRLLNRILGGASETPDWRKRRHLVVGEEPSMRTDARPPSRPKFLHSADVPPAEEGVEWSLQALVKENTKLKRTLEELRDLAGEIGASRNSDKMMERMIYDALRSVQAEQVVVSLITEQEKMTTALGAGTTTEQEAFDLDRNLQGWMHHNKRALISNSPHTDKRFRSLTLDTLIRSILCVPLLARSSVIGVITAYNKKTAEGFADEDARLLSIMAVQAAQIIENARLYETIREEVQLSAAIQLLLPQEAPKVPGYDVFGTCVPARQAGGDYFDFIPMEHDRVGISVGDVSGKGLSASFLMANVQATLRGQTLQEMPPNETLRRSNRLLYRSTDDERFATLFYGVLDPQKHTFEFSNAGHQDPFFYSPDSGMRRLVTKSSVVLGVVDDFQFQKDSIQVEPGDTLLLFSDGLIEAIDKSQHRFGENRLEALIEENRNETAEVLGRRVIEGVEEHIGDAPTEDDLTVVVVRRQAA